MICEKRKIDEQIILHKINGVDKNIQFKMSIEANNTINYLDTLIRRDSNGITIYLYRKPTEKSTVIHLNCNHSLQQRISNFFYYRDRHSTLPITESSKHKEWKNILTIAINNGCPISMIIYYIYYIEDDIKPQPTKFCKNVHLLPNTIPTQFISI